MIFPPLCSLNFYHLVPGILLLARDLPLSRLFINLSMLTWTLGFPIIQWFIIRPFTNYFGAQNVPDLANGSAFHLAHVSLHKLTFTVSLWEDRKPLEDTLIL